MKMLNKLVLLAVASLLFVACGSSSPEAVFQKYIDAAKVVDFKTAKECLSKSLDQEFDDMISSIGAEEKEELKKENANMNIRILNSEIDGDNAIVHFEEAHGDHFHKRQVSLKKEDGEWKMAEIY